MTDDLDWNVLVTAREGRSRDVRGELARLVRLRRTRFRNVLVGRVDDFEALATTVEAERQRKPFLDQSLARILPIEHTFRVDVEGLVDALASAAVPLIDRLCGRSFHVRVERRGHKGTIDSHVVEHDLGKRLLAMLEARGETPVVAFDDADVVVVVELVGNVGGIALVTRELRQRYPFVRID
jgi:tRNA(Ser,Leu) C12 N-acetylase TAN1